MAGPEHYIPIGVYRWPAADIGWVQDYEAFLGMPPGTTVSYVLAYMLDNPTWPQFEQAIMPSSTNGTSPGASAAAWGPLLGGRQLMLSVPACCGGTTWADEASGVNDAHWAALGQTLVSAGLGGCALRIGREMTGSWYRWKATPSNVSSYIAGWRHVVTVLGNAGWHGKRVWNPYIGTGNFGTASAQAAWPGNSYADWIGVDFYDGGYPAGEVIRTAAQQQSAWTGFLTQKDGLEDWHEFADGNGKGLCYPEWGLKLWNQGELYDGGGDNPVLVHEMAAWMKDTQPRMHALWEDAGTGVMDPDDSAGRRIAVPQARAAFLEEFGWS